MYIYGKNSVIEALDSGQVNILLLAKGLNQQSVNQLEKIAKKAKTPVKFVARIELDQLLKTTKHQGVVAELEDFEYSDQEAPFDLAKEKNEQLLLVILDQINDPRNYGAIIRSAEALGAHGVVSEERRSAPLSATVIKVAAGAANHIPIVQVKNLARYIDQIKERNVWVYGAAGEAYNQAKDIDWDRDVALVIGSEGSGMRRLIRDKCDDTIKIPLRGKIDSLNASVAAGILINEIVSKREQKNA